MSSPPPPTSVPVPPHLPSQLQPPPHTNSPSEPAHPETNPYSPSHHDPAAFIPGNPHMLKIASHTAYRSAARPPSSILSKKPAWLNTTRAISLSPHGSPASTPRSRSPIRAFATTDAPTGKQDGTADATPPPAMTHFPGLAGAARRRPFGDSRRVLHTGLYSQLVAMAIPPGGDIGAEVDAAVDQTLLVAHGAGVARVGGGEAAVAAGDVVVVSAGTAHRFVNTGDEPLEVVAVCAPAEHGARAVRGTEGEGEREEGEGVDVAPAWAGLGRGEGGPYGE